MILLRSLLPAFALAILLCGSSAEPETVEREVEWGDERFIEWQVGDAPLVISIPHGGGLRPFDSAARTWGKTARDGHTIEIGLKLRDAIIRETGKTPHVVICHLHRSKLDANREVEEAAQGDAIAKLAWKEYHSFIEQARAAVDKQFGCGLYLDLHGQSHPEGWIEWGYTLTSKSLEAAKLKGPSSIDSLVRESELSLLELISGPTSLGARTQALGYASVPSPEHPTPDGGHYFSGGYSTRRHGSRDGGNIDGVQLELPRKLRMDTSNRTRVSRDLARTLIGFLDTHYEIDWAESE